MKSFKCPVLSLILSIYSLSLSLFFFFFIPRFSVLKAGFKTRIALKPLYSILYCRVNNIVFQIDSTYMDWYHVKPR